MAQVKKFQQGGKLLIDGHEVNLEDYYKYISSLSGRDRAVGMDIYNSARSGNTVNFDTGNNVATGVNWSDAHQDALNNVRKGKGWTRAKARRQAIFGGKGDEFLRSLQSAGKFTIPQSNAESTTDTEIKPFFKENQTFDYNTITNDDGTTSKVWSDSLMNADSLRYFNSIKDAVINWDEESYKTKYNESDLLKLQEIKNRYNLDNNFFNNLETGFKSGNFNDQVLWDNLGYMGFIQDSSQNSQSNESNKSNNDWIGWKNPFGTLVSDDVLKSRDARIYSGDGGFDYWDKYKNDNHVYLIDGEQDFDFLKNTKYKNGVIYKGRLFDQDQIRNGTDSLTNELRKLINNRILSFNNGLDNWFASENDPNNLFVYTGRGNNFYKKFDRVNHYFDGWDDAFTENGDYRIAPLNLENLPNGTEAIGYIDANSKQTDFYGNPLMRFKVKTSDGYQDMDRSQFEQWMLQNGVRSGTMAKNIPLNIYQMQDGRYNSSSLKINGYNDLQLYKDRQGKLWFKGLGRGNAWTEVIPGSRLEQAIQQNMSIDRGDIESWNKQQINQVTGKTEPTYAQNLVTSRAVLRKLGGKLPKLQYGGMVHTARSTNPIISFNDSENIMKSHSKGLDDMTSADKWEAAAMAADLASVISSFTNASGVGMIATGVTGLAGTGSQFVSDVKRDGLDWGDVGRGLLGIGFDVAGIIPGLGTAAKTAKLGKNIAKSANLIGKAIKWGTTAGVAAGTLSAATQTYDKLKSGEEMDLKDYRNILTLFTGLGFGTRAAVNAGRASKAASEVNGIMNKNSDGSVILKSNKIIEGLNDIKLNKSEANELEKLMTKKNAADKVQEFIKNKTNTEIKEEDLSKLLKNYGFEDKSKLFGFKKQVENDTFIDNKKAAKESAENRSTWYYLLHGNQRNRLLNKAGDDGILKTMMDNSTDFSHRTRTYLGNRSIWDPESVGMTYDNPIQSTWFPDFNPRSFKRIDTSQPEEEIKLLTHTPSLPTIWSRLHPKDYISTPPLGGFRFKEGGKIIKAYGGINTSDFFDITKPKFLGQTNVVQDVINSRSFTDKMTDILQNNGITLSTVDKNNPKESSNKSEVPFDIGKFNWRKLADEGLSAGRLFTSLNMNNAQHKFGEKAIRSGLGALRQMPTEIYDSFSDAGIGATYNNFANQKRQIKGASRDYLTNFAIENAAKSEADNIELEGKLKVGQMFDQYQKEQSNLRRQYAQQRMNIADENNSKLASINAQLAFNNASKLANNHQSLINYGMEIQNKNDQIRQENNAYQQQLRLMKHQNRLNPNSTMTDKDIEKIMEPMNPNNFNAWYIKKPQYVKKGAKLRTRLDADEQIWVNNNKATAEAVKKINDNIIKLLMKVLS